MIYAGTGNPVGCKFPAGIGDGEKTCPVTIHGDGDGEKTCPTRTGTVE